jgi:hypothetical protein
MAGERLGCNRDPTHGLPLIVNSSRQPPKCDRQGEGLDNPGYVNLIAVETWNGSLPATQVPGSALPFITIPT